MRPVIKVIEAEDSPRSHRSALSPFSTISALSPITPISPFALLYLQNFPGFVGFSKLAEAETKKADELKSIPQKCGCSKTKCLKLYCECFASNKECTPECECKNCHNTEKFQEEREKVIIKTKTRNPGAFRMDISDNYKICHCTKSNCMKKYCECFQNGRVCNMNCRCKECKNSKQN